MREYIFKEPRRNLTAWLALFGGGVILLLSLPYLGWQWATGMPGILLGLGCVALGVAELLPRSDTGVVVAGCVRIAGYVLFIIMIVYIVNTMLSYSLITYPSLL